MIKLSWQITVLYAIAMIIMGAILILGFYNPEAESLQKTALALIGALLGFGGGKIQTAWEIRKGNNVRRTQPTTGQAEDEPPQD